MAEIEYVREHADGFSQQGHAVFSTDAYVKVRRSFRRHSLKLLKGAPLSVFLCVALSETAPDVQTICADTGYHHETVCRALDFLVERRFLAESGRAGCNGPKTYRPLVYTWSGSDRNAPTDPVSRKIRIPQAQPHLFREELAENSRPDAEKSRSNSDFPRSDSDFSRKNPRLVVDVVVPQLAVPESQLAEKQQQQQIAPAPHTAAQDVLYRAGILPPTLDEFADVELDVAEAWADWIADTRKHRTAKNPAAIAINALRANGTAMPPGMSSGRRKPLIQGPLANALKRREEQDS